MTKCPNCGEKYKWEPDKEYQFRLVHQASSCPFRFDFAHDSRNTIWKWVREFALQRKAQVLSG